MDFGLVGTASGFASTALLVTITVVRQRRFELADIGPFVAAFLAGSNLPAAVFLCSYAFWPDPASVATKLHGLEKFVSFAGLSLALVSVASLWGLCRKAHQAPGTQSATKHGDVQGVAGASGSSTARVT